MAGVGNISVRPIVFGNFLKDYFMPEAPKMAPAAPPVTAPKGPTTAPQTPTTPAGGAQHSPDKSGSDPTRKANQDK